MASALIHEPRLVSLVAPLTGLDAAIARQVNDDIDARIKAGATIILPTHILDVADAMAGRIGIIHGGRLVAAWRRRGTGDRRPLKNRSSTP